MTTARRSCLCSVPNHLQMISWFHTRCTQIQSLVRQSWSGADSLIRLYSGSSLSACGRLLIKCHCPWRPSVSKKCSSSMSFSPQQFETQLLLRLCIRRIRHCVRNLKLLMLAWKWQMHVVGKKIWDSAAFAVDLSAFSLLLASLQDELQTGWVQ